MRETGGASAHLNGLLHSMHVHGAAEVEVLVEEVAVAILLRRPAAIPAAPRGVVPPCTRIARVCSRANAPEPRRG